MSDNSMKRILDSAIIAEITGRLEFPISMTVTIEVGRDDDDWDSKLDTMKAHCREHTRDRWRIRTPMSENRVYADFANDSDGIHFKLMFG